MTIKSINTVPTQSADFFEDLIEFIQNETPNQLAFMLPGFDRIHSGGIGPTSGTLAHTISACIGFPNHYYVSQNATAHTYGAATWTWVYLIDDSDRALTGFGPGTVTSDGHLVFVEFTVDPGTPSCPTWALPLFEAVTNGASIAAVNDQRTLATDDAFTLHGDGDNYIDGNIYFTNSNGSWGETTTPGDYLSIGVVNSADEVEIGDGSAVLNLACSSLEINGVGADTLYSAIDHDHDADYAALAHTHDDRYFTEAEITVLAATLEPAFSKNTGFNLNLGTSAGTVAEGDHTHALIDMTDIADAPAVDSVVFYDFSESAFDYFAVSTLLTAAAVTYENLDANGDVGTSAGQLAIGNHTHAYEPADAAIQSHIVSTANPHSVDETDILPTQGGNTGKVLLTNGTTTYWGDSPGDLDHAGLTHLDYADAGHTGFAPLASPVLTGTPTAPTASVGTDTTQIATTEFVNGQVTYETLNANGDVGNTAGTLCAGDDLRIDTAYQLTLDTNCDNVVADPLFKKTLAVDDDTYWTYVAGVTAWHATDGYDSKPCLKVTGNGVTVINIYGKVNAETRLNVPAIYGERWVLRLRYYAEAGFTGTVRVGVELRNKNKGAISNLYYEIPSPTTEIWTTAEVSGNLDAVNCAYFQPKISLESTSVGTLRFDYVDIHRGTDSHGNEVHATPYLAVADIDDTPVDGETSAPISSNWASDHVAAADPHTVYVLEATQAYQTPTLQNSWVNYGGAEATVQYYKDQIGIVHIKGTVKDGTYTVGTEIFTIPTGYRPAETHLFAQNNSGSFGCVAVAANGVVYVSSASSNTYLSLNCAFRAEG